MGDYRSRRWQDAKKGYFVMLSASLRMTARGSFQEPAERA